MSKENLLEISPNRCQFSLLYRGLAQEVKSSNRCRTIPNTWYFLVDDKFGLWMDLDFGQVWIVEGQQFSQCRQVSRYLLLLH